MIITLFVILEAIARGNVCGDMQLSMSLSNKNSVGEICVDDFNGTFRFQLHLQLSDKWKTIRVSKYLDGIFDRNGVFVRAIFTSVQSNCFTHNLASFLRRTSNVEKVWKERLEAISQTFLRMKTAKEEKWSKQSRLIGFRCFDSVSRTCLIPYDL